MREADDGLAVGEGDGDEHVVPDVLVEEEGLREPELVLLNGQAVAQRLE